MDEGTEIPKPTVRINEYGEIEGLKKSGFRGWLRAQRNFLKWGALELRHVLLPIDTHAPSKNIAILKEKLDQAQPVTVDEKGQLAPNPPENQKPT